MDIRKLKDEVVEKFVKVFGNQLRQIILYGSYARGDYEEYSDFDILLLTEIPRERESGFNDILAETASNLSLEHEILVASVMENIQFFKTYMPYSPFFQNVMKDGIILYDQDSQSQEEI